MAKSGLSVGAPKKTTKVPNVPERASFVLGSRPPDLRGPPIQRIKPQQGVTNYGKIAANPAGVSAGTTGQLPGDY
jgi:hypothetical protein